MQLDIVRLDLRTQEALNLFVKDAKTISSILCSSNNIAIDTSSNIDALFMHIAKNDRKFFSKIYDTLSTLPSLFLLHGELSRQLSTIKTVGPLHTGDMPCVRVDFPNEEKHLDPWHQESSYYDAPEDSFTVWLPFSNITAAHGPVEFALGTSDFPKLEVVYSNTRPYVKITNENLFAQCKRSAPIVDFGELVLFSHRYIHRSSPCAAKTPRCSLQFRFNRLNNVNYVREFCPRSFKVVPVHAWGENVHDRKIFG